jgi:hypothetical protein
LLQAGEGLVLLFWSWSQFWEVVLSHWLEPV